METILEVEAQKAVATRSIEIMFNGEPEDFPAVIHPQAVNRESKDEPLATRGRGPAAYWATAQWLRGAFSDLRAEFHDVVAVGDLVVVHMTMSGRQTGTFYAYDEDGRVKVAFPPTGRTFAVTQSHWLRVADGLVIEHWANRDDQGMAQQLGWVPPSPLYILRMALAKRRAR